MKTNSEIVLAALFAGLDVTIGEYTLTMYENDIYFKVEGGRLLKMESPINTFIHTCETELTEEERIKLVSSLAIMGARKRR